MPGQSEKHITLFQANMLKIYTLLQTKTAQ